MGDFIYNGEHSINFKVDDGNDIWRNTWENWKLAPSVRPVVNPPEPKKEYVDVPGADGTIDYTEALTRVRYGDRTGSWTFLIDNGYWNWPTLYTEFMTRYQGQKVMCQLTDDPDYYYLGRIEVNQYNQNKDYSSFTINYTLEPFKIPLDSYMNRWWLWDELFGTPSYFGPFKCAGTTERNLLNPDQNEETPVYYGATDRMGIDVYRYESMYNSDPRQPIQHYLEQIVKNVTLMECERSDEPLFTLQPGEVVKLVVYGTGIVSFDCGTGKRL